MGLVFGRINPASRGTVGKFIAGVVFGVLASMIFVPIAQDPPFVFGKSLHDFRLGCMTIEHLA
jgi:hypothetical protein